VIYGIWDHIKNSGEHPDAENLALEWVAHIPGKRESRRFEGDTLLRQQDIVGQTHFDDVIAHGGWALDLHPADGVHSDQSPCTQWHSKGIYGIPWRCHYSRNLSNLMLAGRIISATHVAFGSTRVMGTCAAGAQAVGTAVCLQLGLLPRDLREGAGLRELQRRLERNGQFLPGIAPDDSDDLATSAIIRSSSQWDGQMPADGGWLTLGDSWAMLLPLACGPCPRFGFRVQADEPGRLRVELRRAGKPGNLTPDETIEVIDLDCPAGESLVEARFDTVFDRDTYGFVTLMSNPSLRVRLSSLRATGVLALGSAFNKAVATSSVQSPPAGIGIDTFGFWLPKRRPEGCNLAMTITPPLEAFAAGNVSHGPSRPTSSANAWVADPGDPEPTLTVFWDEPAAIGRIVLEFDPDWDQPMESVLMTHPEEVVPFMVRDFELTDQNGNMLARVKDHRGARWVHTPDKPLACRQLILRITRTYGAPAAVFRFLVHPPKTPVSTHCRPGSVRSGWPEEME
jgi:hypothetical protein